MSAHWAKFGATPPGLMERAPASLSSQLGTESPPGESPAATAATATAANATRAPPSALRRLSARPAPPVILPNRREDTGLLYLTYRFRYRTRNAIGCSGTLPPTDRYHQDSCTRQTGTVNVLYTVQYLRSYYKKRRHGPLRVPTRTEYLRLHGPYKQVRAIIAPHAPAGNRDTVAWGAKSTIHL